jgi:hypothetical protein
MAFTNRIPFLLVVAFLIETVCATYALCLPQLAAVISVLHTLAGITIAVLLLFVQQGGSVSPKTSNNYKWMIMVAVLAAMCFFGYYWMQEVPLDYHEGDMLPIIKTMNQRFLSGHWSNVYDRIPWIWNGIDPIYLPAMWLPFSLPVMLNIDLRWLTVVALFIVFCIFLWRLVLKVKYTVMLLVGGLVLLCWIFTAEKAGLIPYAEEGVVILYYVLLCLALGKENIWWIAICASLCLLSRYAFIGWLPAMAVYFIYQRRWKDVFRLAIAGIACIVVLLILPFGWERFTGLVALPSSYIEFTARVWRDSPPVFTEGLGFAKFFGPGNIAGLHYTLIILSFAVPLIFVWLTLQFKKRTALVVRQIPIASLKISLVVFYCLVDVPYLYLFYTSSFVSLIAITLHLMPKPAK